MTHSPDGKLLAVPCGNDAVLFDARTGALVRTFRGHTSRVWCIAFSSDGQGLASGCVDGTARTWRIQTGETVAIYKGHKADVFYMAFSPDGKRVASGDPLGNIRIWETETGKELLPLTGHTGRVFRVAFSPDGTRIVSIGRDDKKVMIWDASNGQLVTKLEGHTAEAEVWGLAVSAKGDRLATGSDKELFLWTVDWQTDEYTLFKKVVTPGGWLAFASDGKTILAGKHDTRDNFFQEVTRWDSASGGPVGSRLTLQGRGEWALYDLSPDGKTLLATRQQPDVPYLRAYDAETGKELFPRREHEGPVWSVAVSPDGRTVASGGADHTVRLWDLGGWNAGDALPPVRTLVGRYKQKGAFRSVAFSPRREAPGLRERGRHARPVGRGLGSAGQGPARELDRVFACRLQPGRANARRRRRRRQDPTVGRGRRQAGRDHRGAWHQPRA
jgi:WD40 repeat protein